MIYYNEEWNEPNDTKEHNISSISNYHPRSNNSIYYKSNETLRDLYFFE
jgi:hypothetical protein